MITAYGKRLAALLLGTALAVGLGVFCLTGSAEAAAQSVTTGRGGWDWTFWGEGEDGDSERKLRYGRVYNRETGEVLSGGWHKVDDYWYFFTASGYTRDQFHGGYQIGDRMGLGVYEEPDDQEEEADPPVRYRWVKTSSGRWKYERKDESSCLTSRKAWIDSKLYLFDDEGYLPKKGWYRDPADGAWYYIQASQACTVGWKKLGGKWYFFDYCTGRLAIGGSFDTKAPFETTRAYYIFTSGGNMRTFAGWLQGNDGCWYRSRKDGTSVMGWRTVDGKDYYFEPAGGGMLAMTKDDVKWYHGGRLLDQEGIAGPKLYGWHADGDLWWYGRGKDYVKDATVIINGWTYTFNSDGYCVEGVSLDGKHYSFDIREDVEGVVQWDDPMDLSEQDFYLLSAIVYTEAGGEDYIGQVAVANVMLNRLRSGKYGKTLEDVVYQPYQFSVTGSRSFRRSLIHGGSSTAMQAARDALLGMNVIGGFDSFRMHQGYDLSKLKTDYTILGCHVFYYEW